MPKIKISDTKQIRVDGVAIKGKKYIGIRQWYATKKDPEFKPAKQGILLPLENMNDVGKAIKAVMAKGKFEELDLEK